MDFEKSTFYRDKTGGEIKFCEHKKEKREKSTAGILALRHITLIRGGL